MLASRQRHRPRKLNPLSVPACVLVSAHVCVSPTSIYPSLFYPCHEWLWAEPKLPHVLVFLCEYLRDACEKWKVDAPPEQYLQMTMSMFDRQQ